MSWFNQHIKEEVKLSNQDQNEGKRKLYDMPGCNAGESPVMLQDVEIIDRGGLRPVKLGENGLHCKELGIELGHCKTECLCKTKWEQENPQDGIDIKFRRYFFGGYTTGTVHSCPPILSCHYFDAHQFEFAHCREDKQLAGLLNEWQKAIGNPHKFNICLVKVRKYIQDKFTTLYEVEQVRLNNKLDTRLVCNHAMHKEVVMTYFAKHLQLICQYFLSCYCYFPEEWEGIISQSLAELPEYKSPISTLAVLQTIKDSYRPKVKGERKPRTKKDKPLITAKDLDQELNDDAYYEHMMSGEWE